MTAAMDQAAQELLVILEIPAVLGLEAQIGMLAGIKISRGGFIVRQTETQ